MDGSNSAVSSSTTYSNGTSVTGTYGTLVIAADGSYTYTADQTAADALDVNDSVTDTFVYTLSDGTATDTANLVIILQVLTIHQLLKMMLGSLTKEKL